MSNIDWQKVARDYEASTLDMQDIMDYARTVATLLVQNDVAPDGYTDTEVAKFEERQRTYDEIPTNRMKRRRSSLLKRLFVSSEATTTEQQDVLSQKHIGYWVLLTESEMQVGKTLHKFSNGPLEVRNNSNSNTVYALLTDGTLQCFRSDDARQMYFITTVSASASGVWSEMSEKDILLLDHRLRHEERETPYNRRTGEHWYFERSRLSIDNRLITGRKGGGCRKLLDKLLEKKGIEPPHAKKSRRKKDEGPVDKTYRLTSSQFKDGCTIRHTFKSGHSQIVHVYPNSRPHKVITVKNKKSGSVEKIMLLSQSTK